MVPKTSHRRLCLPSHDLSGVYKNQQTYKKTTKKNMSADADSRLPQTWGTRSLQGGVQFIDS